MNDPSSVFDAPDERHVCPERARHTGVEFGASSTDAGEDLYGPAITRIDRVGSRWWGHNGEYSTQVTFCPWCGVRLGAPESS